MAGPLEGIRVVDLGFWIAGPAAGGILADWGAEVVKIEPPDGDPFRGVYLQAGGVEVSINPAFELDNRGKRSIALNLLTDEGRAIARKLIERADVFVSNLRLPALERAGLDYDSVRAINERVVYCSVSGHGLDGPDRDRPAYDVGAFWGRAGVALSLTPPGNEPPQQRGGMGDHTTALAAVGAICGALVARQRTGVGQLVSTSLMRTGAYVMGWDMNTRLRFGRVDPPYTRREAPNPLINCYRSADGKWLWLLGLQGDRHWPDLIRALDRPDLLDDERFKEIRVRRRHNTECVDALDRVFATRPMLEWMEALDRAGMWWSPVQTVSDFVDDPQARAGGVVVRVPVSEGEAEMVSTPADFGGTPWKAEAMAPEFGQHTEEILLDLGYDWEQITGLQEAGVIGGGS